MNFRVSNQHWFSYIYITIVIAIIVIIIVKIIISITIRIGILIRILRITPAPKPMTISLTSLGNLAVHKRFAHGQPEHVQALVAMFPAVDASHNGFPCILATRSGGELLITVLTQNQAIDPEHARSLLSKVNRSVLDMI